VNTLQQLNDRLYELLQQLNLQRIRGVQTNLVRRAQLCISMKGVYFEQLLPDCLAFCEFLVVSCLLKISFLF
jgi:hypothetical protein